jgi:hypothetical protein
MNQRHGICPLRLSLLAFLSTGMPANALQDDRMLELDGDYTINVSINGQPFKMMVDPDIGSSRVLNADAATKLGLKGSMVGGRHMVGPVKLTANSNVLNYDFGGAKDKNRTFWFSDRAGTTKADGLISASALPYKTVRFKLRAAVDGEKLYSLPLSDGGNNARLMVNEVEIAVGFNLDRDASVATASTGLLLSDAQGGGFSGPAVATMIRFGVERPTRPMRLQQSLDVGGLPLDSLLVRVSDFGDASGIKDADAPDVDEIVVTGASKRKPRHQMELGRDFLSRCSTLTFDYRVKQVQMSCRL